MSKVFKVVYMTEPIEQWEVHFDAERVGYKAWNRQVALSYAKAMAKKSRPSTILIHDKDGTAEKQIEYPPEGSAVEKKLSA